MTDIARRLDVIDEPFRAHRSRMPWRILAPLLLLAAVAGMYLGAVAAYFSAAG